MKDRTVHIIANATIGGGMSGGDRIFIELARFWAKNNKIKIYLFEDGYHICQRENLISENIEYILWPAKKYENFGFSFFYLFRTIKGIIEVFKIKCNLGEIIYSASDFWPDSLPAFVLKLRNPQSIWIGCLYLFAPSSFKSFYENTVNKLPKIKNILFWCTQKAVYWLIKRYADIVCVTSEPDVKKFITKKRSENRIIVIRGGVDIGESTRYLKKGDFIPVEGRKYDVCFMGRFHPQKGPLELVKIWKMVVEKKPTAKLVMIGGGRLWPEVVENVKKLNLGQNIDLVGWKLGSDKYEIFKDSKIMVHPALYDSGGMAMAEGLAWQLPGVSFDLESLKTYYPKGVLKVSLYDFQEFADMIIKLLDDNHLYQQTVSQAREMVEEMWDWEKRAREITQQIDLLL